MGDKKRELHPDSGPPNGNDRPGDLNQSVETTGESGDATEALPADSSPDAEDVDDPTAGDSGGVIDTDTA